MGQCITVVTNNGFVLGFYNCGFNQALSHDVINRNIFDILPGIKSEFAARHIFKAGSTGKPSHGVLTYSVGNSIRSLEGTVYPTAIQGVLLIHTKRIYTQNPYKQTPPIFKFSAVLTINKNCDVINSMYGQSAITIEPGQNLKDFLCPEIIKHTKQILREICLDKKPILSTLSGESITGPVSRRCIFYPTQSENIFNVATFQAPPNSHKISLLSN